MPCGRGALRVPVLRDGGRRSEAAEHRAAPRCPSLGAVPEVRKGLRNRGVMAPPPHCYEGFVEVRGLRDQVRS